MLLTILVRHVSVLVDKQATEQSLLSILYTDMKIVEHYPIYVPTELTQADINIYV